MNHNPEMIEKGEVVLFDGEEEVVKVLFVGKDGMFALIVDINDPEEISWSVHTKNLHRAENSINALESQQTEDKDLVDNPLSDKEQLGVATDPQMKAYVDYMDDSEVKKLIEKLEKMGYFGLKMISGKLCGLKNMIFTVGLCVDIDEIGYAYRYCFGLRADAVESFAKYDNLSNHPSGEWVKMKGLGKDFTNPNYNRDDINKD